MPAAAEEPNERPARMTGDMAGGLLTGGLFQMLGILDVNRDETAS